MSNAHVPKVLCDLKCRAQCEQTLMIQRLWRDVLPLRVLIQRRSEIFRDYQVQQRSFVKYGCKLGWIHKVLRQTGSAVVPQKQATWHRIAPATVHNSTLLHDLNRKVQRIRGGAFTHDRHAVVTPAEENPVFTFIVPRNNTMVETGQHDARGARRLW
jgi:hypothetical protein